MNRPIYHPHHATDCAEIACSHSIIGVLFDIDKEAMAETIQTRLRENIGAVTADPTTPLDKRLFDEAELVLAESLAAEQ